MKVSRTKREFRRKIGNRETGEANRKRKGKIKSAFEKEFGKQKLGLSV